jgi:hypothetical protein
MKKNYKLQNTNYKQMAYELHELLRIGATPNQKFLRGGPGKFAKRRAQGAKRKHDLRCAQNAMRHAPSPWPPEARFYIWILPTSIISCLCVNRTVIDFFFSDFLP